MGKFDILCASVPYFTIEIFALDKSSDIFDANPLPLEEIIKKQRPNHFRCLGKGMKRANKLSIR